MSKPLILALGYEAQSGKGECASHLFERFGTSHGVLPTSFAKALRGEIHDAVTDLTTSFGLEAKEALRLLCMRAGVPFDPDAQPDALNPFGKQRRLQQHWGTEYRRAQCPTYWVDRVADEIAIADPAVVVLDDLRFANEFDWVKQQGGYTVHVLRPGAGLTGDASSHISECALKNHKFDYVIHNNGTLSDLHRAARHLFLTLYDNHTR